MKTGNKTEWHGQNGHTGEKTVDLIKKNIDEVIKFPEKLIGNVGFFFYLFRTCVGMCRKTNFV